MNTKISVFADVFFVSPPIWRKLVHLPGILQELQNFHLFAKFQCKQLSQKKLKTFYNMWAPKFKRLFFNCG